jgi:three-Cys-motif partner protein
MSRMTDEFFDEQEEASAVKTALVSRYFARWAPILLSQVPKVGYVDLYSGPGRFKDGSKSTPLLVMEQVAQSERLRSAVASYFNDSNPEFVEILREEIAEIEGIDDLTFEPRFSSGEVSDSFADLYAGEAVPTLTFLDPWGYKGLTRRLIESVVRGFGSEAIFFFNYSRINAAIMNDSVEPRVEAIFGRERLGRLRAALPSLSVQGREEFLIQELGSMFDEELEVPHLIPFRFLRPSGQTHYVCFVSKHPRGYEVMKEVISSLGIEDEDGVPKFEFLPQAVARQLGLPFDAQRPITALPQALQDTFRGQTLTITDICRRHHVGTPFILKNYRRVVLDMEKQGKVTCEPSRRRPNTLAEHVRITFS